METSLIRKIIASDLPRKEQDILIMLVVAYNTVDQKKTTLDAYYETENNETENTETDHSSECDSDSDDVSDTNIKPKDGYDCNDHGYNKAMRDKYEERHGRVLSGRELVATEYAEKSISQDHSKAWGLQFPTNTIWGNWVYSYNKD
jgi:hypothetical protein